MGHEASDGLVKIDNLGILFTYGFLRGFPLQGPNNPQLIEPAYFNLTFERLSPVNQKPPRVSPSLLLEYNNAFKLCEKGGDVGFLEPQSYDSLETLLQTPVSNITIGVPEIPPEDRREGKVSIPGAYAHFQKTALRELGRNEFRWSSGQIHLRYRKDSRTADNQPVPVGFIELRERTLDADFRGAAELVPIYSWLKDLVVKYSEVR